MVVRHCESGMEDSDEDASYAEVLERLESGGSVDLETCRKRKRTHNLSWEEKIQLKKLRNRIAAQTSRDRKKARMDYLEDSLNDLKAENGKFQLEIENLRRKNIELEERNAQLMAEVLRISERREEQHVSEDRPQRPAESFDPQQKGPRSTPAAIFLRTLILYSLTRAYCSTGTQTSMPGSPISCSAIWTRLASNPDKMILWDKIAKPLVEKNQDVLREWWGKQQKSWNPLDVQVLC